MDGLIPNSPLDVSVTFGVPVFTYIQATLPNSRRAHKLLVLLFLFSWLRCDDQAPVSPLMLCVKVGR